MRRATSHGPGRFRFREAVGLSGLPDVTRVGFAMWVGGIFHPDAGGFVTGTGQVGDDFVVGGFGREDRGNLPVAAVPETDIEQARFLPRDQTAVK